MHIGLRFFAADVGDIHSLVQKLIEGRGCWEQPNTYPTRALSRAVAVLNHQSHGECITLKSTQHKLRAPTHILTTA